ncbi:MAG TPA: hypothetical protein DDY58_19530 [Terrisporobacter glycolicus]|uniref:hypothetical protein n=1 Tax=Terrisporobacter TaxID=1505652 RepID=UPI000E868442|nr:MULTISPECIES: hypothetical protein [Terrisporobacter]HBI94438.1 hypothetical protein [Terrisporobacter hibernicus]
MKELIENLFWIIVIVFGSMYLLFVEVKNLINTRKLKMKIKYTEESIVNMEIVNKLFLKAYGSVYCKMPDTCIVELEYDGDMYEIKDEEIFKSYEVGQFIKLKLIKSLDENKNLIKYDLFQLK